MSVVPTDPLPSDVQETLVRLSNSAGLPPTEVLREALELYARELEDRQAAESAEQITPRTAELKALLARKPRPSTWCDSEEALF
jgi:predicted DNA-binding protein